MKEELQTKLVEILGSIQSATGKASDFVLSELPDVAQTYVTYGRVASVVWVLFGLFLVAAGVAIFMITKSDAKKDILDETMWDFLGAGYWLSCLFVVGGGIQFFTAANAGLLVWLAPKVWLLKELAAMVK